MGYLGRSQEKAYRNTMKPSVLTNQELLALMCMKYSGFTEEAAKNVNRKRSNTFVVLVKKGLGWQKETLKM